MADNIILQEVKHKQAHKNTKFHALYGYYHQKTKRSEIARLYGKSISTVTNWIDRFENEGGLNRKEVEVIYKKFSHEKRQFIVDLLSKNPCLHLKELCTLFSKKYNMSISMTSVHTILHEAGLSRQVIERRAIQIKINDVLRFCEEMSSIDWRWEQLVFLDEVSFNGSDYIRKHGYGPKGKTIFYKGEFTRSGRISLLCFLGSNGIINAYETDGTFNRKKFVDCVRTFALDSSNNVCQYPGRHSMWLLDGAKIHCSAKFVYYLRSLGIIPVFLPAYCLAFNPIEVVFALVKSKLQEHYNEQKHMNKNILLCEVINHFMHRNMEFIFEKCGYRASGLFDPTNGLGIDLSKY